MQSEAYRIVAQYHSGRINRRDLLASLSRLLGGYAAAHLFLESTGIARGILSAQESRNNNVDSQTVHYAGQASKSKPTWLGPREVARIRRSW